MRKILTMVIVGAIGLGTAGMLGCRQEVAHEESDKPNLSGGRTIESKTTYKNPDGSYTTEKDKVRTP